MKTYAKYALALSLICASSISRASDGNPNPVVVLNNMGYSITERGLRKVLRDGNPSATTSLFHLLHDEQYKDTFDNLIPEIKNYMERMSKIVFPNAETKVMQAIGALFNIEEDMSETDIEAHLATVRAALFGPDANRYNAYTGLHTLEYAKKYKNRDVKNDLLRLSRKGEFKHPTLPGGPVKILVKLYGSELSDSERESVVRSWESDPELYDWVTVVMRKRVPSHDDNE